MIRKILNSVGIQVSRYKKEVVIDYPSLKWESIISEQEAVSANKSIQRKPGNKPFQYIDRITQSSPQMDELENRWWNKAGMIIEEAWVMTEDLCTAYRKPTTEAEAAFFLKDTGYARVLDLGCGSGWMGRMIAGKNLEYIGMDFSSTQIATANDRLKTAPNKEYISYYCVKDILEIPNLDKVNGIIINAFLHHLSWEELDGLFNTLKKTLPKGCKLFMVEPVYNDQVNQKDGPIETTEFCNTLMMDARAIMKHLKKKLIGSGTYDLIAEQELNLLIKESERNGFFFSPKEVPFRISDFQKFIGKYATINSFFHCGVLDLELAQILSKITKPDSRKYYTELLFPYIRAVDQILIKNGIFKADPNNYLFTAFECTFNQ